MKPTARTTATIKYMIWLFVSIRFIYYFIIIWLTEDLFIFFIAETVIEIINNFCADEATAVDARAKFKCIDTTIHHRLPPHSEQ